MIAGTSLQQAARWLILAEAVLVACVAICARLIPPVESVQTDGLSVYGTRSRTLLPYALGMLTVGAACLAAGRLAGRAGIAPALPGVLRAMGWLVMGVLVTPYTHSSVLNWTHMVLGAALFFCQLVLAVWLARLTRDGLVWLLLAAQVTGDLIAFASLPGLLDALLFGEVLSQVAFMPLVAISLRRIAHYHLAVRPPSPTPA